MLRFLHSLPGETLFSRFTRHVTISGQAERFYLNKLFQNNRISLHPYLTVGVTQASQFTGEDTQSIFYEQTLGGFFSYFNPGCEKSLFSSLLSNNSSGAARAAQLVCFRESNRLSIKFCPECASSDISVFGVSYWHLIHQIPGLETCPFHGTWLVHEKLPERSHLKKGFLPYTEIQNKTCPPTSNRFGLYVAELLKDITQRGKHIDPTSIKRKLNACGYTTVGGRIRRKKACSDLYNFSRTLLITCCQVLLEILNICRI